MIYVIIRDMSDGNESVGEMWQETKVFPGEATLDEVVKWAWDDLGVLPNSPNGPTKKRIQITRPFEGRLT